MKQVLLIFTVLLIYTSAFAQNKVSADSTNRESQRITEICGVKFGASYKSALDTLIYTLGKPDITSENNSIFYRDKSYEGIVFDSIYFIFVSDGQNANLSTCFFYYNTDKEKDARDTFRLICETLSQKYELTQIESSDESIDFYVGGLSPIDDSRGFSIGLNKVLGTHYSVSLCYGPYEFVKE